MYLYHLCNYTLCLYFKQSRCYSNNRNNDNSNHDHDNTFDPSRVNIAIRLTSKNYTKDLEDKTSDAYNSL